MDEFTKLLTIIFVIIIAAFILIIITSFMTSVNGLSSLLGGYTALAIGIILLISLKLAYTVSSSIADILPLMSLLFFVAIYIFYLAKYFDKISSGHVSPNYITYSRVSVICLGLQMWLILSSIKNANSIPLSLFSFIGAINLAAIITVGVILHYYSTEGLRNRWSISA